MNRPLFTFRRRRSVNSDAVLGRERRCRTICACIGFGLMIFTLSACVKPEVVVPPGPPEEGFLLGPEDVLDIVVWRNPDLSRQVVIRPDGKISLPLIGDVQASGLTADQLAKNIAEKYRQYKENPVVSVGVLEVNSYYVFVVGEVNTPGKLQLKSYTTVLQALALAGGFTQFASRNDIQVIRHMVDGDGKTKELRIPLRYKDLISEDGAQYNLVLRRGDTIVVP
ncbi:MAG: hypothetical protein D6690_01745 [Nitrospirae bacterium]|nr:MAG: hypothetical protein D6690_01745 [Nitrospirota bacterium]